MAGLADGSASLSMSGREELMALKQTGRHSLSLSPGESLCLSLSHTQHILYSLFAGTKLSFTRIQVLERYKTIVSCDRPPITITEETHSRLVPFRPFSITLPIQVFTCFVIDWSLIGGLFQFSCLRKSCQM